MLKTGVYSNLEACQVLATEANAGPVGAGEPETCSPQCVAREDTAGASENSQRPRAGTLVAVDLSSLAGENVRRQCPEGCSGPSPAYMDLAP